MTLRNIVMAPLAVFFVTGAAMAKEHVVSQKDKKFNLATLKIKAGDSVKFVNDDSTTHHLMFKADGKRVNKKQKKGEAPVVQKFTKPQKTTVRCAIHPKMKLALTVE